MFGRWFWSYISFSNVLEGNSEIPLEGNSLPSSSASTWELSSFNFMLVLHLYLDRQLHNCMLRYSWAGKEPETVRHKRDILIKSIVLEIHVKCIF